MPSSTPGRPGAPRRGIGGLFGLLAVLAFVILAAVIVTRRGPETVTAPPPSTTAPAPVTSLVPPPAEAPPSTEAAPVPAPAEGATPVAPAETPAETSATGKTPRAPRRPGSKAPGSGTRLADSGPLTGRGTSLPPPAGPSPRRFLLGTTSIESLKPVLRDVKGFEADNVGVKRAPEVNGRVELEMDPAAVRPGVDYKVKVYLANDGGKDIPVQEMKISTVENGRSASRSLTPRARNVKPKQRVLLSEIDGVWRESAKTWSMDVVVTSTRQDVYRNRLRWE
jgi:hypothetical protein